MALQIKQLQSNRSPLFRMSVQLAIPLSAQNVSPAIAIIMETGMLRKKVIYI